MTLGELLQPDRLASLAILITALGTFIVAVAGATLQFLTFNAGRRRDEKLTTIHDLVDGQSEKLSQAIESQGFEKGRAAGIVAERADPQVPATVNKRKVKP